MARPRPVPPKRREIELSAWANGSNSRVLTFSGMPGPLSATSTRSRVDGMSLLGCNITSTVTPPASVNLMALPIRLSSTWRNRVGSPRKPQRAAGSTKVVRSIRFSRARGANSPAAPSTRSTRSKSIISSSTRPASSLEMSRTSLMTASNDSALSRTATAHSRCSSVSCEPSRMAFMPMMPFIGVRISCDMCARKSVFARLASSARARA